MHSSTKPVDPTALLLDPCCVTCSLGTSPVDTTDGTDAHTITIAAVAREITAAINDVGMLLGAQSTGNSRAVAAHVSILTTDPAVALETGWRNAYVESVTIPPTPGAYVDSAYLSACRRGRFLLKVCSVDPAIEFTPGSPC